MSIRVTVSRLEITNNFLSIPDISVHAEVLLSPRNVTCLCFPFALLLIPADTGHARYVIAAHLAIASVHGSRNVPEVINSVIQPVAVEMVDHTIRPFAVPHQPYDSARFIRPPMHRHVPICGCTAFSVTACFFACFDFTGKIYPPKQFACTGAIDKNPLSLFVCKHNEKKKRPSR